MLEAKPGRDSRVVVVRELLPDAESLVSRARPLRLIACQYVLEHIHQDVAALSTMATALRFGGQMTLLVPAHSWLYCSLGEGHGHYRRYERDTLSDAIAEVGLEISDMYSSNLLGVPGWWLKGLSGTAQISAGSLRAYEALVKRWRTVEDRRKMPAGVSLIAQCSKPAAPVGG